MGHETSRKLQLDLYSRRRGTSSTPRSTQTCPWGPGPSGRSPADAEPKRRRSPNSRALRAPRRPDEALRGQQRLAATRYPRPEPDRQLQLDTLAEPKPSPASTLRFLVIARAARLTCLGGRSVLRLTENLATNRCMGASVKGWPPDSRADWGFPILEPARSCPDSRLRHPPSSRRRGSWFRRPALPRRRRRHARSDLRSDLIAVLDPQPNRSIHILRPGRWHAGEFPEHSGILALDHVLFRISSCRPLQSQLRSVIRGEAEGSDQQQPRQRTSHAPQGVKEWPWGGYPDSASSSRDRSDARWPS